jgi:hypothetical protein
VGVTREERLAQLRNLNQALERRGVEPPFSEDVMAGMSNYALRHAVKIAQDELVRATKVLDEQ